MPIIGAIGNASEYAYRSNLVSSPDPFDFIDLFDVDPGLTYYSDYVKITGFKSQLRVTIEPGASYSLFASVFDNQNTNSLAFDNDFPLQANFSQDLDPILRFTTDSTFIKNNQSIRLSRTIPSPIFSPASFDSNLISFDQFNPRLSQSVLPTDIIPDVFGSTYTSVVSIGTSVQDWIIQVVDVDSVPDPISIPDSLDVLAGVGVTTLTYTITGLEPNIKFSSFIVDGNGGIIIDGITPSATNTLIGNGDIINLDTISSDYGETKTINFGVGTYSTTWNVTTQPLDLSATFTFYQGNPTTGQFDPNGRTSFNPITNGALSTQYNTSTAYGVGRTETFVIGGINVGLATDITFTSGASYEVRRPFGGTLIKGYDDPPIQVINGDAIRVRLTSSSNYSTAVTTTATVGTTSQQVWSITTQANPGGGGGGGVVPPPPVILTNTIVRYYNGTISDHFYGFGSAISGSVQVDHTGATIPVSYDTNATCFIGDEANGNDAIVNFGDNPTFGGRYYFIRPISIYQVTSTTLLSDRTAGGGGPISNSPGLSVYPEGLQVIRPNGLVYNRYLQRVTNLNNGLQSLSRSWRFDYSLFGYSVESGSYFRCYQSNPGGGAQQLYLLYSHSSQNHLLSLSSSEGSPSYSLVQSLGWVYPGTAAQPSGTRPLYRIYMPSIVNHFYTISDVERANVIASGAIDEGRIAWVL